MNIPSSNLDLFLWRKLELPKKALKNFSKAVLCWNFLTIWFLDFQLEFGLKSDLSNLSFKLFSNSADWSLFFSAFQESIKCQIEAVKSHCDREALQYFQDPMQVRGKEMNQHCLGFIYPPEKCGIVLNRSMSKICHFQYGLICSIIIIMMKLKEILAI